MSTRIIAAVYNDAIRARRVITPALEPFSVAERGRWLEMRPTRGRRGFRVAFLRDLPFSTFPSLRAHVGSELRERLAAAAATEEGLVFALLAYEDQSLQRHLWAVSGVTEIERSIDDRDRARRVWIEGGRRKTQKATIDVDPAQFGTGDAFDDDAYDAAVRTAEAPFCAIQWLEDETAITLDALIGAWLDADDGEDVAAGGSAPPDGPFSAYERLQLRARSAKVRADAVLGLQRHPPSAALFDVLTAALRDPDADVRRMGACVAFLLRPDEATRATPQARTFSDAMSGLLHALSETVMDDESGRTHATATDLAEAIAMFDQDPAAIVAWGVAWLQSTETDVRTIGARLLVRRSEEAAEALARGLRDKHPDVRKACARALSRADALPAAVGHVIADALASARGARRKGSDSTYELGDLVSALGRVRGAPDLVVRTLRALLDDGDVLGWTIEAFGASDAPAATRRACVWPWLGDPSLSTSAVNALHEIGVDTEEILAGIEALGRRDEKSRRGRCDAYFAVARWDARGIAPIERMLDDRSWAVVCHALDRLAWAMEFQPAARPALERAATHPSEKIQAAARKRLRT